MTTTQKHFAQIEKDLMPVCFGVKAFHQYVYAKEFVVETHQKLLISKIKKILLDC